MTVLGKCWKRNSGIITTDRPNKLYIFQYITKLYRHLNNEQVAVRVFDQTSDASSDKWNLTDTDSDIISIRSYLSYLEIQYGTIFDYVIKD